MNISKEDSFSCHVLQVPPYFLNLTCFLNIHVKFRKIGLIFFVCLNTKKLCVLTSERQKFFIFNFTLKTKNYFFLSITKIPLMFQNGLNIGMNIRVQVLLIQVLLISWRTIFEQFWRVQYAQKSKGASNQLENVSLNLAQIFMEASLNVQSLLINQLSMQHPLVPRNTCFLTFSFRCLSNKDKEKVLRERHCLWKEDFEKVVKNIYVSFQSPSNM